MLLRSANLSQLADFDEIVDVRTPSEFAEDHLPGAINCPVLSDEERITVGTLYKQVSPFEARKVGAALVARNIAHHLETRFAHHPKSWKPLIYCWRGGQRSGAMSIVLTQVGWAAHKLEGGYKTYRHWVLQQLETLPGQLRFRILCGPTGCGKSRLLQALQATGAQVLDLEALACHRGSVLGGLPQQVQPSAKWFETRLVQTLRSFDPARPVYVEAESNRIGRLTVPPALLRAMHGSDCLLLDTALPARVQLLLEDYRHFLQEPQTLIDRLQALQPFHSHARLAQWAAWIRDGAFARLVEDLLTQHYDRTYQRALGRHFTRLGQARRIALDEVSVAALHAVAQRLQQEQ
ncbi:MAG: tRNA 2-selenouridine(34) synthase MnmH [Sideroxydans sp.]